MAALAAVWQMETQLECRGWGDAANEGCQPGTDWQAQPKQLGCLANGFVLWKGFQGLSGQNGFSAASKNAAVTQLCSSGLFKTLSFTFI